LISPKQNSLNDFIIQNNESLTHIIVDNNSDLQKYLVEIYDNEYEFLELIYEYKMKEKERKFKVFKINYNLFNTKYIVN
jgi:hypothetical protein